MHNFRLVEPNCQADLFESEREHCQLKTIQIDACYLQPTRLHHAAAVGARIQMTQTRSKLMLIL